MLINAIPHIAQAARTHDTSRACLICGQTGHNFDNCPAMLDSKDVKTAYIKIQVALN